MKGRPRILIVEDSADLRRLYAIGLNQRGFEVKLAANGAEAVDRIVNDSPDLVILDIFMPLMSGWEVIDRIQTIDKARDIPVIVVSGHSVPDDRPRPASVIAWLSKPVSLDDLAARITEIAERTEH